MLKFSPLGAYITSWQINDREVLYQGSELRRGGIPSMFPNFDAGAPLPNHGFGRISNWQTISKSNGSCHLKLTDQDISSDFKKLYPHQFIVELKIIATGNKLNYQIFITNTSKTDLPISPGLHPYWPIKHQDKNKITTNLLEFDAKSIDWDHNPPDYTVDFNRPFIVNFPDYRLTITDTSTDAKFNHLQIWSQNTSFPDHNFICFEPMTRPKNGININPIIVKHQEVVDISLCFKCDFTTEAKL
jgi:galactose mutarotase-like enzyme